MPKGVYVRTIETRAALAAAWPLERRALMAARTAERSLVHGHNVRGGRTRTYNSWCRMKERTTNPNNIGWSLYGARGITVCDRWLTFENFLVDMGERPEGTSLDRIDPDGNYEPGNTRWATPKEQRANRRKAA